RVKGAEDDFHARPALFRMDVNGHAATVVGNGDGLVLVQNDVDFFGVAGQGLVHAVVDDFLGQVVGPGGVGVHARALAHRLNPGEDFDIFCEIVGHHPLGTHSKGKVGRGAGHAGPTAQCSKN